MVYLIQWKLCWTAESNIDDLDWVKDSYKAQNQFIERRCSARVEETAEARLVKRDEIMAVIRLEDFLKGCDATGECERCETGHVTKTSPCWQQPAK